MSMSANRIPGVRAAVLWNSASAAMSRRHNDANVACFGARIQPLDDVLRLLDQWLVTPFDGGRHARRVGKIEAPFRADRNGAPTRSQPVSAHSD